MAIRLKSEQTVETLPKLITGEALAQMGETAWVELVKGEIVMMSPTGSGHSFIEGNVYQALVAFLAEHKLGRAGVGEVGIYTGRNPDTIRAADVIFISHERLAQVTSTSFLDVAPELVVEIMSPGDTWRDITDKIEEYFRIGVLTIWVVDPDKQQTFVYHSPTDVQRFAGEETLPGGQALPEFKVAVSELFRVD